MSHSHLGYRTPVILFPKKGTDLSRWSTVACDQYTSQENYWNEVEHLVGDAPSTLWLMLPEVWLKDEAREASVAPAMKRYLADGTLRELTPGMIWVRRHTTEGDRRGLVLLLDLEAYDYAPDSTTLIRATEATVAERLPARVRVREKAAIEMPHIMVLIDDPTLTLASAMEPTEQGEPFYDFPLMMEGGQITGWRVPQEAEEKIDSVLSSLAQAQGEDPMLFAVGDGNHSLAAARLYWQQVKSTLPESAWDSHPARFALAEIVNLHDPALVFEPIHRILTGVDGEKLMNELCDELSAQYPVPENPADALIVEFVTAGKHRFLFLDPANCPLPLRPLQALLDEKLAAIPGAEQDYIHGDQTLRDLSAAQDRLGILLPALDKNTLFTVIRTQGPLPRKCFSMGEAQDKRFYLECRALAEGQEVQSWE